jgi:hypothetical protein
MPKARGCKVEAHQAKSDLLLKDFPDRERFESDDRNIEGVRFIHPVWEVADFPVVSAAAEVRLRWMACSSSLLNS